MLIDPQQVPAALQILQLGTVQPKRAAFLAAVEVSPNYTITQKPWNAVICGRKEQLVSGARFHQHWIAF